YYEGKYWPSRIEHVGDELTLQFVEQALYLMPLGPRDEDYNPLDNRNLTAEYAKALADAALDCWQAILKHDIQGFGRSFRAAFDPKLVISPNMVKEFVLAFINRHKHEALGWKLSGAGGGGYVIFVAEQPIKNAVRVSIRREME